MRKKTKTIWRLWSYSLGEKHGKDNNEADIISIIRTIIFVTYFITNSVICLGVIRHWNDSPQTVHKLSINAPNRH